MMVIDRELVRQILIKVAAEGHDPNDYLEHFEIEGFSENAVSYHVWLLKNGGFLSAMDDPMVEETHYVPGVLTYAGQEFLAAILSKGVWEQTKVLATKGGDQTVKALWDIAKRIAERKLDELLKAEGL